MIQLQQQDREVAGVMISTSLTEAESERLLELAAGKLVLEIGSSYGYSTVLMATVARHVITVDCFDNELVGHGSGTGGEDENRRAVLGSGLQDRITLIVGPSQNILPRLRYGFDLIFVDGDHRLEGATSDLTLSIPLLMPGGTLAVHDAITENCPEVGAAIRAVLPYDEGHLTDTLWTWTNV